MFTVNIPSFFLLIHFIYTTLLNPLTIFTEICCYGLDSLAEQCYTGLLYCPCGVRT
jgi:hypothetical protein